MALKSARIVDFCGKSSGLADFENTVDRGSAVNFGSDSGLYCVYICVIPSCSFSASLSSGTLLTSQGHPTDRFGKLSVRKAFNPL